MSLDLSQLSVLHVEDDYWVCQTVREFLPAFGVVDIGAVRDGYAGYDALRDFAADIFITDWVMAPMDGYEFTQMVRCAPDSPNPFVPIIMMTSRNLRDEVERARDICVTEYLVKPITAEGLRSKIVSVIESPREFIRGPHYFGPDRRRTHGLYGGADRRKVA